MAVKLSAFRAGLFLLPGSSLVLISVIGWIDPRDIVRLEVLGQPKNPMTSSGIEPATFRLVASCLNHLRYRVPCDAQSSWTMQIRMMRWWWRRLWKNLEETLMFCRATDMEFAWRDWRNPREISVIQTEDLPNTSLEICRYSNHLSCLRIKGNPKN
jgi:hypothetical protein